MLFVVLAAPMCVVADEPIPTRNHRALSLAFLRFEPAPPVLAKGERRVAIGWTVANDLRRAIGLDEDYELQRLALRCRWGAGRREDLWVEAALIARGGGFLDSWIDAWHRSVLGWTDPVRDATPRGRSVVASTGRHAFGPASGLGDVTVGWTRAIGEGTRVSAAVKAPVGNPGQLLGSGAWDLGVSLDHRMPLGRGWGLALQAALIAQGKASRLAGAYGLADQELVALTWRPNSKDVWTVQWQSERAPVRTGVAAADATHRLVTFGYRRALGAGAELELYFSEDRDLMNGRSPEIANIGPDFTAGVRLSFPVGGRR